MPILIRNARVLTFDDARTEHARADVLVEGNVISAVGPDLDVSHLTDLEIVDGAGKLVMPGLINAHLHSPANLLKGALEDFPLEIFMLYEVPPMGDTPASARLYYLRAMLGAIEMLKLGITSVHDDAFFNPAPLPENIDGVMNAYRDSGIRATVAIDQPNILEYEKFPFLADLLPESEKEAMRRAPIQSGDELLSIYGDFVDRWHRQADGRLMCSTSCSAPQRVTPEYLQGLTEFSRTHDLPFNIHILETRLQRVLGDVRHGKSLIRYVHDLGCLDERKFVIHAVWVDDADIALMADSGCTVGHNPISNLKIGSGVMRFRALRDAGIPIAVGTDEAAVDDSANIWQAAKTIGLIQKVTTPDWTLWPKADEILDCVLLGGAQSMRLSKSIGRIAPGYQADLILLDLDTIAFTPLNDLKRQLVYTENGSSVVMTMVAGRIVMRDGKILTVDEAALKAEIREAMREHESTFGRIQEHAARLLPHYRAMYEKALAHDVGMMRWVPPFATRG
ncbi:amidohydrolase family protein [Kaistia terrae]|uniref:Amidohydrolase family protein n=1 Tax=Kaistia terrae TaxID=537017 RepID=A0ABW0PRT1_9HYPH|nr:amidohydrolase family protein [Kaistia terrae]MCX5578553.1 amidohydrolase family protein [Kaistia terrae]